MKLVSAAPVLEETNSIFLQARLLHESFQRGTGARTSLVISTREALRLPPDDILLCHYGGYDASARKLARRPRTVFVFHNITPARLLLPWTPLVALRAVLGYCQLAALPRQLPWLAMSPFNQTVLHGIGFGKVAPISGIVLPGRVAEKSAHPSLLFVGRICPNKNSLALLEAYQALARSLPQAPELIVIGPRKHRCLYGRAFEKACGKLSATLPLRWIRDPLGGDELAGYYARSWLYVSTSLHEGIGLPVMEAVAAGTPAVYFPSGGTEAVMEGVGCVRDGAIPSMVETCRQLLQDRSARESLLTRQRETLPSLSPEHAAHLAADAIHRFLGANLPLDPS